MTLKKESKLQKKMRAELQELKAEMKE